MKDQPSSFKPLYDDLNLDGGLKQPLSMKRQIQKKVSPFSEMAIQNYSSLDTLKDIQSFEVKKIKQKKMKKMQETPDGGQQGFDIEQLDNDEDEDFIERS